MRTGIAGQGGVAPASGHVIEQLEGIYNDNYVAIADNHLAGRLAGRPVHLGV